VLIRKLLFTLSIVALLCTYVLPQAQYFSTSVHGKRAGKAYWYGTANGGFETLTGVPVDHHNLECAGCHGATDANGAAYTSPYTPGCVDCHANNDFSATGVTQPSCLKCHSRQANEINNSGYSDVHRTAGMTCMSCHKSQDMHGDGVAYQSMLEEGAIKTKCSNAGCHPTPSASHATYDPHGGKLDCSACHTQSVISCYNCHFESQVDAHLKRAKQMIKGFVLLVNKPNGKVGTASFQSLSYQGKTWAAFGPYTGHTITRSGRLCADCHNNAAIQEYNSTGQIYFAKWNSADSTLSNKQGAIPIPSDYKSTFKIDFITYNGLSSDAVVASKNWSKVNITPGQHDYQMLFATPLTAAQMSALTISRTVPVELTSFTSSLNNSIVTLQWQTATEKNNKGFEVQRKIGTNWELIGFVSGKGTSTEVNKYSYSDNLSKLTVAGNITYRLRQVDFDGTATFTKEVNVNYTSAPKTFELSQNHPNPFNPSTTIRYALPFDSNVKISIYKVTGELVKVLMSETKSAGNYEVTMNTSKENVEFSSGIYFYQIEANAVDGSSSFKQTKKMILLK